MQQSPRRVVQPLDWPALVAETIRRRKEEGMTQVQHAALAGVGRTTVVAFDQGDTSISLSRALAILGVVGLVAENRTSPQDAFVAACRQRWEELVGVLAEDAPARQPHGHYSFDYEVAGPIARLSSKQLVEILEKSVVRYSGWPAFWVPAKPELAPVPVEDGVECWLGNPRADRVFDDAAHSDYWRASTEGRFYLQRGYQEDGADVLQPGTFFDVTLPIWRAGEGLSHATRVARSVATEDDVTIRFRARYTGLDGRDLATWAKPANRSLIVGVHRSRLPEAHLAVEAAVGRIEDELAGVVHDLLRPLYERFGGYVLEHDLVERELREMKSREETR
jgi:transcriptional regulator with XRE-family HTH domain